MIDRVTRSGQEVELSEKGRSEDSEEIQNKSGVAGRLD